MWPISIEAAQALLTSHRAPTRLTAVGPGLAPVYVPVIDGEVTADSRSQVRRTARVTVDPTQWPADPGASLSPLGAEVQIDRGIVLASGATEWVPLIAGPVQTAERTLPTGAVEITVADRSQSVADNRFDSPQTTVANATYVAEITRLITETQSWYPVLDLTGSTAICPQTTIDRERWSEGIEKLADAIGAEVFCRADGYFVIRPQPVITADPVWTIASGQTGTLVSARQKRDREGVYNKVVASGQRSDGTAPVSASVQDTDTTSMTFYGGAFGKKPRFYTSPMLTTVGQCTATATSLLARATGAAADITLGAVPNPALDCGDVILAQLPQGRREKHIIDQITTPLRPSGVQSISSRSTPLPTES